MGVRGSYLLLAALAVFLACSPPVLGKEPEEIWKELGKLSGEERHALLLLKARAEGEVVWYTSSSIDSLSPLRKDFEKRYPKIKIKIWRASGERILNRILAEARAGRFNVDIVGAGYRYIFPLMRTGLVGRYISPERKFYPDIYKDQNGYWTSHIYRMVVMAYNTTLVSRPQAPRRYEDFLDPKWKGNFAIDTNPHRTLMAWLKIWGNEKTEKFLQGLIENEAAVRRGHTLVTQLLCAGEFKAAIELFAYRVAEFKHKGCPVEMVFPDPTPGSLSLLYLVARSPHPYAAALLVDYVLSKTGQRLLAEKGLYSARRGIKLKYPEMNMAKRGIRSLLLRPKDAEQFGKNYLQLRERYLLVR